MITGKAICPRKARNARNARKFSTDKFWFEYVGRAVRALEAKARTARPTANVLKSGNVRTIQSFRAFRGQNVRV
jgi:hypothetical protein